MVYVGLIKIVEQLSPNSIENLNNLAATNYNLGNVREAMADQKKILKLDPDFKHAFNNLGACYVHLGNFDKAIEFFKKAVSLARSNWTNIYFPFRYKLLTEEVSLSEVEDIFISDESIIDRVSVMELILRLSVGTNDCERMHRRLCKVIEQDMSLSLSNPAGTTSKKGDAQRSTNLISLVHFGRSGSGFLHALIDNHPDVVTLPSIYFSEYFDRRTWEYISRDGWSGLVENFVSYYDVLFDSRSSVPVMSKASKQIHSIGVKEGLTVLGKNKNDFLELDRTKFAETLSTLISKEAEISPATFFELVHLAFDEVVNGLPSEKTIFYHIHNPDCFSFAHFIHSFPEGKLLMIVRDPLQSCESWAEKADDNYLKICQRIIQMLVDINHYSYQLLNSKGIRLEDLKKIPDQALDRLSNWMGINYSDSLTEMTMMGKKWWGDPASPDYKSEGMKPFGQKSILRPPSNYFDHNDRAILKTLFYPFSVRFGYTESDEVNFQKDLNKLPELLDGLFSFEKQHINNKKITEVELRNNGHFKYFRAELLHRYTILKKNGTYPNMLEPLIIK